MKRLQLILATALIIALTATTMVPLFFLALTDPIASQTTQGEPR